TPAMAWLGFGPLRPAAAKASGPNPSQAIAGVATITYTSGLIAPSAIGSLAEATSLVVSFGVVTVLAFGLVLGAGVLRSADRKVTGSAVGAGTTTKSTAGS
ncbi:MFS transporter, partial [Streptomyces sp. MBT98]|nr:MFS transporter [Streptomyces sp. MBT98]